MVAESVTVEYFLQREEETSLFSVAHFQKTVQLITVVDITLITV